MAVSGTVEPNKNLWKLSKHWLYNTEEHTCYYVLIGENGRINKFIPTFRLDSFMTSIEITPDNSSNLGSVPLFVIEKAIKLEEQLANEQTDNKQ